MYGKLLYRTQKAKLQNKIKAIIWFQGETDNSYAYSSPGLFNPRGITDPYGYPAYFDSLYKGWDADSDFEKVYVFQIRQVACSYQNRQSVFREVQRQLQTTYHDTVQVIPTVGIGNRADDNCHYKASGYDQLAHNLFRRLRQDFYSITDSVDMRPPNIVKAFYSSFDKKQIGMIFSGSKPGSIPADSLNRNIKNYFYLNNVRTSTASSLSLSLSKDTLTLTMPESQNASYLKYLPNQDSTNIYNGPFIRNSKV
ncbi:MAG: sialate O-acetylesterase [Ignavibacteria bacterium]